MSPDKKSKRQERREKIKQREARSRLITIILVMLGAALILVPFVFLRWNLTKRWGILFSGLYVAYVLAVLM